MRKGKLEKFAQLEEFENVFQAPYSVINTLDFDLCGHWNEKYFGNDNPITLELGCGKGEYTIALAQLHPERNFIGVDIKGARIWSGAKQALKEGLHNVAFLRTEIEFIDHFFASGEVEEIWLTFSDPQMKKVSKRLTGVAFLNRYRHFLKDRGVINVKTDSQFLTTYTQELIRINHLPIEVLSNDIYATQQSLNSEVTGIRTYYEQMWLVRGIKIKYMRFLLPHNGKLIEPDIEIEPDEYRSYGRNRRTNKYHNP